VQVRRDEGVANYIGPEPCAVAREGGGGASVGEHIGQPLGLAKIHIPGADGGNREIPRLTSRNKAL
jgi:hypothetical protein